MYSRARLIWKRIQSLLLLSIFSLEKLATLRTHRKLAAVPKETQEEHPKNGQSRNMSSPRVNKEYISQFLGRLKAFTDTLRNRSQKIPEHRQTENHLPNIGSFPEWFSSRSRTLRLWFPSISRFRPRRGLSYGDKSSKKPLLLPWDFFRKTKEFHESATILQWKHPCDNWIRPAFVSSAADID